MKKTLLIILTAVFLSLAFLIWNNEIFQENGGQNQEISNFMECVEAGYPVMESYPRQCRIDEQIFIEDIGNIIEKSDLIRVDVPRPNGRIESPLAISGEARGYWFFEASFPVKLFDESGNLLGIAIAQAKSEWMTEEFVPFEAVLEFSVPASKKGTLIFQKDNPSGLPEYDDELSFPVFFSE